MQMRYCSRILEYENDEILQPRKVGTNEGEDVSQCGILKLYHRLSFLYKA